MRHDKVLLAEVADPALTTVMAPMRKARAAGVGNVLALASGAQTSGETLVLPMKEARGARVHGAARHR